MKYPPTSISEIADDFYQRTNFPNVIGAVDGKHIWMVQPQHSETLYFNYKKIFSCVLMASVDADYNIIAFDVGSFTPYSSSMVECTFGILANMAYWFLF